MTLEQYMNALPEAEQVAGAERYFAGDLMDIKKETTAPGNLARVFQAWAEQPGKTQVIPEDDFKRKYCDRITGKWQDQARKKPAECTLWLNQANGIPGAAKCACDTFKKTARCPHVAALMAGCMAQTHGEDVFRGTRVETRLREMTGTTDPFLPGVLKRSDDRLLSVLGGKKETGTASLPVFVEKTKRVAEPLCVDCVLEFLPDAALLEVLVGSSRKYVIHDMRALLDAYENGEEFQLGSTMVSFQPENFRPEAKELMDRLKFLWDLARTGGRSRIFVDGGAANPARQMILQPENLDYVMSCLDGQTIRTRDEMSLKVVLDHPGLKMIIRKQAFGANVKVEPLMIQAEGNAYLYLTDTDVLFRIPVGETFSAEELKEILSWREPIYIRESDLPAVFGTIAPYFQEHGTVVTRGLEMTDYRREKPEFRFELDLEGGVLTCHPVVIYASRETSYSLYDDQTDPGLRNAEAENVAADLLGPLFDAYDPYQKCLSADMDEDRLYAFMKHSLPELENLGAVMATDAVLQKKVRTPKPFRVGISVTGANLTMSLKNGDMSQDEVMEILGAYRRKKKYHVLKSGNFVSLEEQDSETLETLAELWQHYGDSKDPEHMSLPLYRALYVQEMLEKRQQANVDATDEYRRLVKNIGGTDMARQVPGNLKGVLRPYQEEGFRWIHMLKTLGFGGILADDMGLGKTLQVLAFLLSEKESGKAGDDLRTLIICPASLVYNWEKEIRKFTPELRSMVISGQAATRRDLIAEAARAEVLITSYDTLKRDIALYEGIHFANEIVDEAQFIKNQNAQASRSVRVVNSDFRLALTGTPIENHLGELWSIMDYLMPGFLYHYAAFQKEFEVPVVVRQEAEQLERLRRMVHPFILRRMKKQVLKELPEKLEETVTVELEGEQKKLYEASAAELRQKMAKTSDKEFRSGKLMILAMLTRLRQICCDPALVFEKYAGGSAKLEACMQLVREAVDGGHKLLLFSQFTSMLDIIGRRLTEEGIAYHRIDGATDKQERMRMVDDFASDDVPVFCISLKAGGTGLNLTAADIVIHYDPWWNQAAQDQATDRTHRIGQTQKVTVYELIAAGTIEEQVMRVKESKSQLAEDVLSGESVSAASIDREDLLKLLGNG